MHAKAERCVIQTPLSYSTLLRMFQPELHALACCAALLLGDIQAMRLLQTPGVHVEVGTSCAAFFIADPQICCRYERALIVMMSLGNMPR